MTWNKSLLGQVCEVQRGTMITQALARPGSIPVVAGGTTPTYFHDVANRPAGTITVSASGANAGFVNFWNQPIFASDCSTVTTNGEGIDIRFVYHQLRSMQHVINGLRSGAAQPHVYAKDIAQLPVKIPPLSEQRRIATLLDKAEELRAKRSEALAQLNRLAQSIFVEMFGDPVSNPFGWEKLKLEDLTNKVTDGEHLNPSFSDSGMPIIMAGNVLTDKIDLVSAKRVETTLGQKFRQKCGPEFGDLLIVGRGATIGRLCRVNTHESFCLMGSVILIKPKREILDEHYLSLMLTTSSMHAMLYNTSGSSAQQAIYLKDVKRLNCPVPPLVLQKTFATRLQSIETLKTTNRLALQEHNLLFESLQQKAFTGAL